MKKVLIVFCGLLLVASAASAATLDRRIGKMATVKRDGAQVREGRKVIGTLAKGDRLRIYSVQGGFALVRFAVKPVLVRRPVLQEAGGIFFSIDGVMHEIRFWVPGEKLGLGWKPVFGYVNLRDLDIPHAKDKGEERNYKVGQTVIVTARQAKLMLGKKVLGSIPEGTRLKIEKVKGHWFGVFAQIAGKKTYGWVKDTEVDYPPLEEPGEDKKGSGMR